MPGPILNPGSQGAKDCIEITFAGSGFKKDLRLGAAPLVSINRDYIKDGAGSYIGVNNKVTLTGKIYPSGSVLETSRLLDREKTLRNLFGKAVGDFYIYASGAPILSGINAKILSYDIEKTPDNWTRSVDYTINLEFYESTDSKTYRVSRVEENWSIEPLEDYLYANIAEYDYTNYPQFRVTRKLSAVGIPESGYMSHYDKERKNNSEYNLINVNQVASGDAYMQARMWVNDRLDLPFNHTKNKDAEYTSLASESTATNGFFSAYNAGFFLFNHNRSINYSITDGSFEVNDSWLSIPSNRKYTEEFSIETSTDNKNIRTTKIQGTVKGLSIAQKSLVTDELKTPDIDGNLWLTQHNISGEAKGTEFYSEKYINASSGWLSEVKTKLVQRVNAAVSNKDRTQDYLPGTDGLLPPGNPVFRKERSLNPIPVSTSESHDPFNGTISYTHEYNNSFKIIEGVVSENYKISINGPADQFAETFVLARPIGPILQALDTKTTTTKSVSIDLVLVPPTGIDGFSMDENTCPVWTGGYVFGQCESFIQSQKPLGTANQIFTKTDTYSWSPTEGRYTRNVEWLFQPCTKNGDAYQIFY